MKENSGSRARRALMILPCAGSSESGQTTLLAACRFARENDCSVLSIARIVAGDNRENVKNHRLVVVEGCERKCVTRLLEQWGLAAEETLRLGELGMEYRSGISEPDEEAIALAADGIEACCAETGDQIPQFGGCCC